MPREIDLFNAMVPSLLIIFAFSIVFFLILDKLTAEFDIDRYIWHPALFRTSLFCCFFCVIGIWWYK